MRERAGGGGRGGRERMEGSTNTHEKYPLREHCTPTFRQWGMSREREGWPVGLGRSKMVLEDVDM